MTDVTVSLIVAADDGDVIGRSGALPWYLPADLKRFRRLTTGHVLVAGRKTHESIVERLGRPLPDRITVVATRQAGLPHHWGVVLQPDVDVALETAQAIESFAGGTEVFVIGGGEIYAQALPRASRVYLTRVHERVSGDTLMPPGWLEPFDLRAEEAHVADGYTYRTYERG